MPAPIGRQTLQGFPPSRTSFVGRHEELGRLRLLLSETPPSLITVIGPGGVGKTRLILQVMESIAEDYEDGVIFVPLSPVRDAGFVAHAIVQSCNLPEPTTGIASEYLIEYLHDRRILLILDNFEHVLPASGLLVNILNKCPEIQLLLTSRVRIRSQHERVLLLEPLPVPNDKPGIAVASIARIESVDLFVQRAQAVNPGFALTSRNIAAVAHICIRLDGLPLAIELAAARTRVISPERILGLLLEHVDLLTGGPVDSPERLQTMRSAIEWSYYLLDENARRFFRRLAIFIGGWDIDGASAMSVGIGEFDRPPEMFGDVSLFALGSLESLIDHSLLRRSEGSIGIPRFTMLETLREFGLEELKRLGEFDAVASLHTAYCIRLAERGTRELIGPDQTEWLERLDVDYPNVRAALDRSRVQGDAVTGLRASTAIAWYWRIRGLITEGRIWLESFLSMPTEKEPNTLLRAAALRWTGELIGLQGDVEAAEARLAESLALFRQLGDQRGIAGTFSAVGIARIQSGLAAESVEPFLESANLHRSFGDMRRASFFQSYAALGIAHMGDMYRARSLQVDARNLALSVGEERSFEVAFAELVLGSLDFFEQRLPEAATHIKLCLSIAEDLSSFLIMPTAHALWAHVELADGNSASALRHMEQGFALSIETGFRLATGTIVAGLVILAVRQKQWEYAGRLVGILDQCGSGYRTLLPGIPGVAWDANVEIARTHLGDDVFAAARQAGKTFRIGATSFDQLAVTLITPDSGAVVASGSRLSRREREVLELVAAGMTDREIAAQLFISRPTASKHVTAILAKLGVRTRAAAAALSGRADFAGLAQRDDPA